MTLTFSSSDRIAGFSPALFRKALRTFAGRSNPGQLIGRALFSDTRQGAIVYEECLDRGMIQPHGLDESRTQRAHRGVTAAGISVISSASSRMPKAKAEKCLSDLLDRIDVMNASQDAMRLIDEIWIFGSMIRDVETVGDIDIAVVSSRGRPDLDGDLRLEEIARQFRERRGPQKSIDSMVWMQDWLVTTAVFGGRVPKIFSGFHGGYDDLLALAVPCRLIYDRSRGGRVSDPVLPRHPQSTGRHVSISPATTIEDIQPVSLRPMDARWVSGYDETMAIRQYPMFRNSPAMRSDLFPVNGMYADAQVISSEAQMLNRIEGSAGKSWRPVALKTSRPFDCRHMAGLVIQDQFSSSAVRMERNIDISMTAASLDVVFHSPEASIGPALHENMPGLAAVIILADVERLVRRQMEDISRVPVFVRISLADGEGGNLSGLMLADDVADAVCRNVGAIVEAIEAENPASYVPQVGIIRQ